MTERDPYISITRTIDASPEAVFEAWTSPTEFGRWFGRVSCCRGCAYGPAGRW